MYDPAEQVRRHIAPLLRQELNAFRVVIVNGPRQSGKSTVLRQLHGEVGDALRDLDREELLEAAQVDPADFVSVRASGVVAQPVGQGHAAPEGIRQRHGLVASLQGLTVESLSRPIAPMRGRMVEKFVHNELVKQRTWADADVSLPGCARRGSAVASASEVRCRPVLAAPGGKLAS